MEVIDLVDDFAGLCGKFLTQVFEILLCRDARLWM
jgi:hypothetical protein